MEDARVTLGYTVQSSKKGQDWGGNFFLRLQSVLFGVLGIAIRETQIPVKPRVFREGKEVEVYKGKGHKVVKASGRNYD